MRVRPNDLDIEYLAAPHEAHALHAGHGAVYVFALADSHESPARPGTVLKVGRVGPKSNARFQSQHYSPSSARSGLARSLLRYKLLWPWLGIEALDESTVRDWMLTHLDRANVYVPESVDEEILRHLEMYLRARLGGSVFEGSA